MAFNRSFNLQDVVSDLYPGVRRQVLFSLVGSLNATIIGAADSIALHLEREGYDLKELSTEEIDLLTRGPETGPEHADGLIHEQRLLVALAEVWRTELRDLSENVLAEVPPEAERVGSLYGTLAMMTGKQRARRVAAGAVEALRELDIQLTPEQVAAAQANLQSLDQARADARAARRGAIEFIVEHVFYDGCAGGHDGEYFDSLPVERREALVGKFFQALNNALNTAQQNVLFGRFGSEQLGLGDITLIRDLNTRLMSEAYPPTPVKVDKPKMRRVKKEELADELKTSSTETQ